MSTAELLLDKSKPWLNSRVNKITTDIGVVLPSTNASILNYYETKDVVMSFACRQGTAVPVTVTFTRTGNVVSISIPALTITSGAGNPNNVIVSDATIPAQFLPSSTRVDFRVSRIYNAGGTNIGPLFALSNGTIEIYKDNALGAYNITATVGTLFPLTGSWIYNK